MRCHETSPEHVIRTSKYLLCDTDVTGKRTGRGNLLYPPYPVPPQRGRWGEEEKCVSGGRTFFTLCRINPEVRSSDCLCQSLLLLILSHLEDKAIILESVWFLHS